MKLTLEKLVLLYQEDENIFMRLFLMLNTITILFALITNAIHPSKSLLSNLFAFYIIQIGLLLLLYCSAIFCDKQKIFLKTKVNYLILNGILINITFYPILWISNRFFFKK